MMSPEQHFNLLRNPESPRPFPASHPEAKGLTSPQWTFFGPVDDSNCILSL